MFSTSSLEIVSLWRRMRRSFIIIVCRVELLRVRLSSFLCWFWLSLFCCCEWEQSRLFCASLDDMTVDVLRRLSQSSGLSCSCSPPPLSTQPPVSANRIPATQLFLLSREFLYRTKIVSPSYQNSLEASSLLFLPRTDFIPSHFSSLSLLSYHSLSSPITTFRRTSLPRENAALSFPDKLLRFREWDCSPLLRALLLAIFSCFRMTTLSICC